MIEKFQQILKKKFGTNIAYYTTCFIYIFLMLSIMFILSYLFDNFYFAILSSIIINVIRRYTYGYHEHELFNCILLTNILILIFGYISKGCPLWVSFFVCSYCIRDLYLKSPLELNFENKSIDWHRRKLKHSLFIFIVISLIALYFNYIFISNCILWSIIMTDILLFKNIDKEERL